MVIIGLILTPSVELNEQYYNDELLFKDLINQFDGNITSESNDIDSQYGLDNYIEMYNETQVLVVCTFLEYSQYTSWLLDKINYYTTKTTINNYSDLLKGYPFSLDSVEFDCDVIIDSIKNIDQKAYIANNIDSEIQSSAKLFMEECFK